MKRFCLIFLMLILFSTPASAMSYQYNQNNVAVLAPDGYNCLKQQRSDKVFANANWDPSDMFVDEDKNINVLDSNNGRVHIFNKDLEYISSVSFRQNDEPASTSGISGLFVTGKGKERKYFVADPYGGRVFISDYNGNIISEILRPNTELIDENTVFAPTKVLLDKNENLYVLVPGIYMGACVFSKKNNNYEFLTFTASNSVEPNFDVVMDYFWKQILSKQQIARMKRYVPIAFSNFTIDNEGYIYTVTNKSTLGNQFQNEIKKFNTTRTNILPDKEYGDLEVGYANYILQDTSFVDIAVNENGNMIAIDATMCRIHVFDALGNRLFSFGERKNVVGGFDTVAAVEVIGNDIYVLDKQYETISLFRPTPYGQTFIDATNLYDKGKYLEAEPLWDEVLKQNSNSILAHLSKGKAKLQQDDYKGAMEQFILGNDRENYSNAFEIYRDMKTVAFFPIIFILAIAIFVFLLIMERKIKINNQNQINPMHKSFGGKIRYTLFHPSEGGMVLARHTSVQKTGIFSAVVICLWFILSSIDWQFSGFIFNLNDKANFEVIIQLLATAGVFVLWVISSWFVSNLINSSARLNDICIVTTVALLPTISGILLHTILSNVLTISDGLYLTVIQVVLMIWSVVILIGGLKEVHELSFSKTILSIIYTIFGMALLVFMLFLVSNLFQQVISFVGQVWTEFMKMI
jgi:hypothetical protein